ncbi:cupredoxin domain-containing protein [Paraburkholderia susongensis]|uniref:Plastocyanin n=1 Tax=Paraburkholderia susongensis TaxID=1515439 RepID=A0A1X7LRU8_9BURK|nr:Plastocyanin [Paraburkholderia susongensis]
MQTNSVVRALLTLPGGLVIFAAAVGLSAAQTPAREQAQVQAQMPMHAPEHAQSQAPNAVVIKNFMFTPMALTIKVGSTVTWKNLDGEPHTVVNDAGMFRSAALDQNDTYQFKFDKPGVYKVFCGIHPNMRETITVQ